MRYQIGWLFARSRRRSLVSNLAITAFSAPATRRPSYQHHCCTRRPFHGATHLLQVANESSQSDIRPPRREVGADACEQAKQAIDSYAVSSPIFPYNLSSRLGGSHCLAQQMMRSHNSDHDVQLTLEISFMEAVQGCTKTVTFQTNVFCGTCGGTGGTSGELPKSCRVCYGKGEIPYFRPNRLETCSLCGGLGKDSKTICQSCKGLRLVKGMKSVQLDLMPGVDDGETIKIPSGAADSYFDLPGSLSVTFKVREDHVFRRAKSDIHVDATLGVTQAIFGGFIQVPSLTGEVVVKVDPGTQPGHTTIIRGKGIKTTNSECYGDQYVHFNVRVPVDLVERQRMLVDLFNLNRDLRTGIRSPQTELPSLVSCLASVPEPMKQVT